MALASASKEAIWFANIFNFTVPNYPTPSPLIMVDNQGAIKMARNDSSSIRTKHIDIQYHFVGDSLEKKLISVDYCATSEMAADILTKPLDKIKQEKMKRILGIRSSKNDLSM